MTSNKESRWFNARTWCSVGDRAAVTWRCLKNAILPTSPDSAAVSAVLSWRITQISLKWIYGDRGRKITKTNSSLYSPEQRLARPASVLSDSPTELVPITTNKKVMSNPITVLLRSLIKDYHFFVARFSILAKKMKLKKISAVKPFLKNVSSSVPKMILFCILWHLTSVRQFNVPNVQSIILPQ